MYAAFGLAVPPLESPVPADEERLIRRFLDVWAMVDDAPEVAQRAAHLAGDGVRRIAAGTLDLFDDHGGSPPDRMRRGMSLDEAMQPSFLMPPMQRDLLEWLNVRHTEHDVFERIVTFMERAVTDAGRAEPHAANPPAIAFVDLTGYTALTATDGDERAAEFATTLHVVASRVVAGNGGRVVKQLGDGVLLRFRSGREAIDGVRELVATIADAGLPAAHAGIAVGPFVVRDGDVYGNVVNLAARIAAYAGPGETLLPIADAEACLAPGEWDDAGTATLRDSRNPSGSRGCGSGASRAGPAVRRWKRGNLSTGANVTSADRRTRVALLAAPETSASVLYGLYDVLLSVGCGLPGHDRRARRATRSSTCSSSPRRRSRSAASGTCSSSRRSRWTMPRTSTWWSSATCMRRSRRRRRAGTWPRRRGCGGSTPGAG